jgi:4-carboxymuconolactone decarboxylase
LLDHRERSARGLAIQAEVTGLPAPDPTTLWQEGWRDFVFGEVWARPMLDRRSRFLIAMAGAAMADATPDMLDSYVRGALTGRLLTQIELREASLHLAVYGGWSRGGHLDSAVTRVCNQLELELEIERT